MVIRLVLNRLAEVDLLLLRQHGVSEAVSLDLGGVHEEVAPVELDLAALLLPLLREALQVHRRDPALAVWPIRALMTVYSSRILYSILGKRKRGHKIGSSEYAYCRKAWRKNKAQNPSGIEKLQQRAAIHNTWTVYAHNVHQSRSDIGKHSAFFHLMI